LTDRAPDPDAELVIAAGRGEAAAVRSLVTRKLGRILALAHRMLGDAGEAEDVAQETFVKAWKAAAHWRPGKARFDTWLHRVALNLCYDRLRRRRETPVACPPERADDGPGPEASLFAKDIARRVDARLMALPPRQREAIVLCHYQELGNIEAAAAMGLGVEALESLLARGRRTLRAQLADLMHDAPVAKRSRP